MAYTTTADVKAQLDITTDTEDDRIDDAIEAAEAQVNAWTGRVWETPAADESRYFRPLFPWGREVRIGAAQSITTVSELAGGSWSDLASSAWQAGGDGVDPTAAAVASGSAGAIQWLWRLGGGWPWESRISTVRVAGKFAYRSTPPPDISEATMIWAARLYERRDAPLGFSSGGLDGGSMRLSRMDPDVHTLLQPHRRLTLA